MINEPTIPTSIENLQLTPTIQGLWVSSVMPWELDLPWQYEAVNKYTTTLTNLTI
jgi:hypothetical protein